MKILLITSLLVIATRGDLVLEDDLQAIIDFVNSSGAKWKAGRNFAANFTSSSLKNLLGVKKENSLRLPLRTKHLVASAEIPEHFDSREQWPHCPSIRHIRDQGNCGSCWAVAAAGAFTDRLCIATNGKFTAPLSQEELLSCCTDCGDGCNGGEPSLAWKYFEYNGIVTGGDYQSNEGCQPYEIVACSHHVQGELPLCDSLPEQATPKCQRKCTNPSHKGSFSSDHHKIKSAYRVSSDPIEIQKEIMTHGPVEADFMVYADFPAYKSGVYHYVIGRAQGHHAVKIIGWGVEDGTPYWLVANQWNETWGDKGLFKILRGTDECAFEDDVIAGIPKV